MIDANLPPERLMIFGSKQRVLQGIVCFVMALFAALSITGCRRDKLKGRYDEIDGGYVPIEACDAPTVACYDDCVNRKASVTCVGCCRDQRFLCDTGQVSAYESCTAVP